MKLHRAQLEEELVERSAALHRVESELRSHLQACSAKMAELERTESELRTRVAEDDDHLQRLYAEIERLNALVTAMESTTAWRVHRRIERLRGK